MVCPPPARHLRWIQDKAQDRQGARARRQECAPGRRRRRRRRIKRRERVREGARKSEQERFASPSFSPPCPRLLLPPLPPNHCKPRGPGSPTSKQELSLERVQKPDQLYCQSLIIVGDKIQMKCQTLKACVVATLQRILGIAQTRRSNVGNVIGLMDLGSTWSRMVWYVSGMI